MKFIFYILRATLVITVLSVLPVKAETDRPISNYQGGGYTVKIEGFAGGASYTGCDAKKRCITILEAAHYTQGSYIWENQGYTYSMSPDGNKGQYRLKIYNPKGKKLLNQLMNPK
jgi:hypothetical protein